MGYIYVPDTPPQGPLCGPMQQDPIQMAKANVRYYKSIIAEANRAQEKDKKEKDKKKPPENPLSKLKAGHVAAVLLFTWWVFPLSQLMILKVLHDYWETAFK